ncbi:rh blood group, D antigen [Aplochiton taeniatus]
MAPQYSPSIRSRLSPVLLIIQTVFIIIFALCVEIDQNVATDGNTFVSIYSEFQDVNVMVILGFGFLATFLVRYGFSGSGFNLVVAVMATQWAVILNGIENWYWTGKKLVDLKSLVAAEMCAASVLIAMGAVLGKTNPSQLLLFALLEVIGFIMNGSLLQIFFKVTPLTSFMLIHIFGAFFGLMVAWVLYREGSEQGFEKEKSDRKTGLFALLGTLFLWMFWPSFNSVLVDDRYPERKLSAIYSTYLALAVSAVTACGVSVLSSTNGKLNLVHIHRCTLAGGVAIGVAMSVVHLPLVAMLIGLASAVISTLGCRYLTPHMLLAFECHDTCSVLSIHGLPGLFGWLAHLLLQIADSDDYTMAVRFAVIHICTLLVTLCLSMAVGVLTGLILKLKFWRSPQDKKCFDDQAFWEFPHLAVHK